MHSTKVTQPLTPEQQAFADQFIGMYGKYIRCTAKNYLGSALQREIEDVVQDVCRMVCEQLDDFAVSNDPHRLLRTITARRAFRVRKKLNRFVALPEEDLPAPDPRPQDLSELLPASTSAGDREILQRFYERQEPIEKIAQDLGISPATARQRLKRARDRLGKNL